jgi:hypothetical protein
MIIHNLQEALQKMVNRVGKLLEHVLNGNIGFIPLKIVHGTH